LNLARINAKREAEARDAELNTEVEKKKAVMELERLRATTVTQAVINKESAQQRADAELYAEQKNAEGKKFAEQAEAEAAAFKMVKSAQANQQAMELEAEANFTIEKRRAEAEYFKREREAEARLITQQKEAEGLSAMAKAYGDMAGVLGGPQGLMQYLMLQNNVYERLANANANAIKGLQPKINVWNTGASGNGEGMADPTAPIRNLFQALPPLLSTINDQTGIQPPSWLAQMPQDQASFNPKHLEGGHGHVSPGTLGTTSD
jgi:flotillin